MIGYLKKMLEEPVELTPDERNLLLIAYKHILNPKQFSWRVASSMESEENVIPEEIEMIRAHRKAIESEIESLCNEVLTLIDETILPRVDSSDGRVFFHKMKGDYNRYLLEIQSKEAVRRDVTMAKALESYSAAHSIALKELKAADPVRLGVALNFSVFYHENCHAHELACQIAKTAFETAFEELNRSAEDWNKETTTIMQLIKENLTVWLGPEELGQAIEGGDEGAYEAEGGADQ
jgi:14-3-3 protein epsilon